MSRAAAAAPINRPSICTSTERHESPLGQVEAELREAGAIGLVGQVRPVVQSDGGAGGQLPDERAPAGSSTAFPTSSRTA